MNAPVKAPSADDVLQVDVNNPIGALAEAQSRKRIADAWLTGSITGDMGMQCLIGCELIEFSPNAATP